MKNRLLILNPLSSYSSQAPSFLNINVIRIIHKTNGNGNRLSSWKIRPWIYPSPMLSPEDVNSSFHGCMLSDMNFLFSTVPNISRHSLMQLWGTISYAFLWSIHAIVFLLLRSFSNVLSINSWFFVPRLPFREQFC